MRSFRILTDAMLLHLAQKPLIVLAVVFLLICFLTAILVKVHLRRAKAVRSEDDPCS